MTEQVCVNSGVQGWILAILLTLKGDPPKKEMQEARLF